GVGRGRLRRRNLPAAVTATAVVAATGCVLVGTGGRGLGLPAELCAGLGAGIPGLLGDLRADDHRRRGTGCRRTTSPSPCTGPDAGASACSGSAGLARTSTGTAFRAGRRGIGSRPRTATAASGRVASSVVSAAAIVVVEDLLRTVALGLVRHRNGPVHGVLGLLFHAHLVVDVEAEERDEPVHHVG